MCYGKFVETISFLPLKSIAVKRKKFKCGCLSRVILSCKFEVCYWSCLRTNHVGIPKDLRVRIETRVSL